MLTIQSPVELRSEYTIDPIGIDTLHLRFSWILRHSERNSIQSAYHILVASNRKVLQDNSGNVWDSGKVNSETSVNIEYAGKPLESFKTYYWKVRWWDSLGQVSPFSKIASFETGMLKQEDWKAEWIGGGDLLRSPFIIDKPVQGARVYISGLGYYELRINGNKTGNHVLDPGWTDYDKIVLYSTFDITGMLRQGENAVGIMLGNGRYSHKAYPANLPQFKQYEQASPKVIAQFNLEFKDGSKTIIISDTSWKVSQGPIVENDLYDGETYDARLEKEGWDSPGYDDSEWKHAELAKAPAGKLKSQATLPPIKAVKNMQPIDLSCPRPGIYVYDFGQNFAGWVRLKVSGPRGSEVKLRYAELLNPDGMINQSTLDQAKATDIYILKGEGVEIFEPRFTYHGFRYVEVTGFPGTPNLDSIEGRVVHSAVEAVGGFQCSNSLINNIHRNIIWGQLSNLMSIPTDCAQRSERMGWMGDAQLTVEEAIFNFNVAAFYTKYIGDIRESQRPDGCLPNVVPLFWWDMFPADPAWGTACITIPWHLYLYYGDHRVLEENYQAMKNWVDYLTSQSEGYLVKNSQFGDWCAPGGDRPVDNSKELVGTWYYYQDVITLSQIVSILGKLIEAEAYAELAEKIKEAFNKEFIREEKQFPEFLKTSFWVYGTGSQTCHILPLYSDMVPEDKKESILNKLVQDIEKNHGYHLNTGIIGTRYILDTLTKYGKADLAYILVTQTSYPSWGYMLREGATTLWERWEYLDGKGINSHNHIMFGTVDAWFYKTLAGINIDPSEPGFRKLNIKPYIPEDLAHASASVNTIRGIVSSSWRKEKDTLTLDVTIPVNSQAKMSIPTLAHKNPVIQEGKEIVFKNGSFIPGISGILSGVQDKKYITFEIGSGTYSFMIR